MAARGPDVVVDLGAASAMSALRTEASVSAKRAPVSPVDIMAAADPPKHAARAPLCMATSPVSSSASSSASSCGAATLSPALSAAADHSSTPSPRNLTIAIPQAGYYRTPTALRRVLKRLRAADATHGLDSPLELAVAALATTTSAPISTMPPAPAYSYVDCAEPEGHVVVELSAGGSPRRARKRWRLLAPVLDLHPALLFLIAVFALAAGGLRAWPV